MTNKSRYPLVKCSFCGKSPEEVGKLITGPSVHICNECVDMCNEILREGRAASPSDLTIDTLPTPAEMKPSSTSMLWVRMPRKGESA